MISVSICCWLGLLLINVLNCDASCVVLEPKPVLVCVVVPVRWVCCVVLNVFIPVGMKSSPLVFVLFYMQPVFLAKIL